MRSRSSRHTSGASSWWAPMPSTSTRRTWFTGVALVTKDVDLALIPPLDESPDIDAQMRAAGFRQGTQPGIWNRDAGQVDLLVPEGLSGPGGRRAARLPGHGRPAARKVTGIEGAAVDNAVRTITAYDPLDQRSARVMVAGPGALLISKAFKVAERAEEPGQTRLADKDAFDAYRLLQLPTSSLVSGISRILHDPVTRSVGETGVDHVRRLFGSSEAIGSLMAGGAVEGVGEAETVRLATAALTTELLEALAS